MTEPAQPVVWLGDAGPHRAEAARALSEWARVRGVVLSAPAERASPSAAAATDLPARVERELARAQEAVGAADADQADRALARAEAIVREHPDALTAAWLRAEVLRAWSARWLRLEPHDEARARAAWQEAEALDGGRVPGIGERAWPKPAQHRIRIAFDPRARITIDGRDLPAPNPPGAPTPTGSGGPAPTGSGGAMATAMTEVAVGGGEHAVVASVDGAVVYAAWVAVAGPTTITIPSALESECTRDAFATARREGDRIVASGATCAAWIAAISGDAPGRVLVARCERDACSTLVEWRVEHASTAFVLPPRERDRSPWPAWATWTLVGVGAATIASVALVAAGAFDSQPVERRFVVGGARQE